MFTNLDHIGIAVQDLDAAMALYAGPFGLGGWERIVLPERHMELAVAQVGGAKIELIAATSEEASFAAFLRARGPGIHHVAYQVENLVAALESLRAQGVPLVDETPRPGIHGTLVAFVHPKGAMGTLIELVEYA
jgi:methylmalonyl-CoA/ethylmalonyl-CoA epimerase